MFFFFQAEDGIRDLVRSRGLGDVYKRQFMQNMWRNAFTMVSNTQDNPILFFSCRDIDMCHFCLLYTSDAADERSSVDLGGRRIIKKKNKWKTAVRVEWSTTSNEKHI